MHCKIQRILCSVLSTGVPSSFHQIEQGLGEAVFLAQGFGFRAARAAALAGILRAEHDVLRRMLKVNELYHIHLIACVLKDGGADRIRQQGADALLDDAVFKQQVKLSPAVDAGIHLMLAAGHGENAPDAAVHSVGKGVVRSRVAGVERHDHVNMRIGKRIPRHIRDLKMQPVIAVARGNLIAALDDVGLEIIADDAGAHAFLDGKVIIKNKSQVRFAAAEIKDAHLFPAVGGKGLVDKLDETVYLPVLAVFGADDLEVLREHAEVDKRRDVLSLAQKIFLLTVMCGSAARHWERRGLSGALILAVHLQAELPASALRDYQHLTIPAFKLLLGVAQKRVGAQVPVKGLVVAKALGLIGCAGLGADGTDDDLFVGELINTLGENGLGQTGQRVLELLYYPAHIILRKGA